MYPYLSDYLTLTSKTSGHCVQIFDGCRTLANAADPEKADSRWQFEDEGRAWSGCCCWTYAADSYDPETNPDPWYDPQNPATHQVAGALIDPPDGDGNGFYLEPSISNRVISETGNTPLEMYATFTIVAATAQGERAWLDWFKDTILDCCSRCAGWTAEIRLECPCPPDDLTTVLDEEGCLIPPTAVDSQAPPPPTSVCEHTGVLEPWVGDAPVYDDLAIRQLLCIRFTGLEQLSDGPLWECGGNRYKVSFEVTGRDWFSEPVFQCTLGGLWDPCECLCDPIEACDPVVPAPICGPETVIDQPEVFPPSRRLASTDTVGGLICLPGRYNKPERFMASACLTAPQPLSLRNRLKVEVFNGTATVNNARLAVWEAIEGIPRPDTDLGWETYRQIDPVYDLPIIRLRPFERIIREPNCSTTVVCATGQTHKGQGTVEQGGNCEPDLTCGNRYWVVLMLPCDEEEHGNLDLRADVYTVAVGSP